MQSYPRDFGCGIRESSGDLVALLLAYASQPVITRVFACMSDIARYCQMSIAVVMKRTAVQSLPYATG